MEFGETPIRHLAVIPGKKYWPFFVVVLMSQ
jgi:hypothetical protein